jgi:hypothetical protein
MSKSKIIRYESNPFLNETVLKTKSKKLKITNSAQINDETWINSTTGELVTTQLYTYREVDESQFVKLFTQNIGLAFNLTSAGIKALSVLIFEVQRSAIRSDIITLDDIILADFLKVNNDLKLSRATFYVGISELIKSKILARYLRTGTYFINPNFVFNGDRLLFVNAIKKKSPSQSLEDEQLELDI